MKPDDYVYEGSDNVFADIGLPDAEERLRKAPLALAIRQAIQEHDLTQAAAAERMGITQPEVSRIVRGRLAGFTFERLLKCLTALGRDVEIVIRHTQPGADRGDVRVCYRTRRPRRAPRPTGAIASEPA